MARFIDDDQVGPKGMPAPGAFMLAEEEDHLSVNCTDYETVDEIVNYYSEELQRNGGAIKVAFHKIEEHLRVFKQQGFGKIVIDQNLGECFVDNDGSNAKPFKHRPVAARKERLGSPSHSGAEFIRAMDEIRSRKFARKMAARKYVSY